MSAHLNRHSIIGNLGQDPELRYTASGLAVANLSVAVNERWIGANEEPQEHTEWFRVVVWGKRAEACARYLSKGQLVYVEGHMRTEQWTDREQQTRSTTKLHASDLQFLTPSDAERSSSNGSHNSSHSRPNLDQIPAMAANPSDYSTSAVTDDDIPF